MAIPLSLKPMEAETIEQLPTEKGWLFEPKYDGFRCLAFRDGSKLNLQSKRQKGLGRYFPEIVKALLNLKQTRFLLDGEIIIPGQTFEHLQLRFHPAETRIQDLAKTLPAQFVAFDLLSDDKAESFLQKLFAKRRAALKAFMRTVGRSRRLALSKATRSVTTARRWINKPGFDGVMAKRLACLTTPDDAEVQSMEDSRLRSWWHLQTRARPARGFSATRALRLRWKASLRRALACLQVRG